MHHSTLPSDLPLPFLNGQSEGGWEGGQPNLLWPLAWASLLRFEPNLAKNCHAQRKCTIIEIGDFEDPKMHQNRLPVLLPKPRWGSYSGPPNPLAGGEGARSSLEPPVNTNHFNHCPFSPLSTHPLLFPSHPFSPFQLALLFVTRIAHAVCC